MGFHAGIQVQEVRTVPLRPSESTEGEEMIDQDKMRALAKCLRADADFAGQRESGSFDLRYEAAAAIDILLAEVEAAAADKRRLSFELVGVIIDVEHGHGFDDVCLATIKRVEAALAQRQEGS